MSSKEGQNKRGGIAGSSLGTPLPSVQNLLLRYSSSFRRPIQKTYQGLEPDRPSLNVNYKGSNVTVKCLVHENEVAEHDEESPARTDARRQPHKPLKRDQERQISCSPRQIHDRGFLWQPLDLDWELCVRPDVRLGLSVTIQHPLYQSVIGVAPQRVTDGFPDVHTSRLPSVSAICHTIDCGALLTTLRLLAMVCIMAATTT